MPAKFKGTKNLVLSRREFVLDAQSGNFTLETEYQGTQLAVSGASASAAARNQSHQATLTDGYGRIIYRQPITTPAPIGESEFPVVRYEVFTESIEDPIWKHPTVITAASAINNANTRNAFRRFAEAVVAGEAASINVGGLQNEDAILGAVIRHLGDEVIGFEKEHIVIRRFRRVPQDGSIVASISAESLIYSTAQLQLPDTVAFSVPDSSALSSPSQDYGWGWRRRPSNTTYDGIWIEQTGEFVLAPWSLLFYSMSNSNAGW